MTSRLLLAACGGADANGPASYATTVPPSSYATSSNAATLPPSAGATIQHVVLENFRAARRCYDSGLATNPALSGTIILKFAVDASGSVVRYEPTNEATLPDPTVVNCVNDVFAKLVFPQSESRSVIAYPMTFSPGVPRSVSPPFDRAAAAASLGVIANDLASCKNALPTAPSAGQTGSGHVKVTFNESGSVDTVEVDSAAFFGTPVGDCVAAKFRSARVPPFSGSGAAHNVVVGKSFEIRSRE